MCQKYGGRSDSHNTNECNKYEKDGTLKSGWGKKSDTKASGKSRQKSNSYAQLQEEIADLKKAIKAKSKPRGRKKRHYDSSDSSDSE